MKKLIFLLLFPLVLCGQGRTHSEDPMLEISRGNINGISGINKFGHNGEVTTASDPEDLWEGGGLYTGYPTLARALTIVSGSDLDTIGGTGVRSVEVQGLDANWNLLTETVVIEGTDSVVTSGTFIRVFRVKSIAVGTGGVNAGAITVTLDNAADTTMAVIAVGEGQTMQCIYTVPLGKTAYLTQIQVSVAKGAGASAVGARVTLFSRAFGESWLVKDEAEVITHGSAWVRKFIPYATSFAEKSDIRIQITEVTGTIGLAGGFGLVLVDN